MTEYKQNLLDLANANQADREFLNHIYNTLVKCVSDNDFAEYRLDRVLKRINGRTPDGKAIGAGWGWHILAGDSIRVQDTFTVELDLNSNRSNNWLPYTVKEDGIDIADEVGDWGTGYKAVGQVLDGSGKLLWLNRESHITFDDGSTWLNVGAGVHGWRLVETITDGRYLDSRDFPDSYGGRKIKKSLLRIPKTKASASITWRIIQDPFYYLAEGITCFYLFDEKCGVTESEIDEDATLEALYEHVRRGGLFAIEWKNVIV